MEFTHHFAALAQLIRRQYAPQLGAGAGAQLGAGAQRAAQRLAEKRRANEMIPHNEVYTRQQARADLRRYLKDLRSLRKECAMDLRLHGGAAVIRYPLYEERPT